MKRLLLMLSFVLALSAEAAAQCAMCRSTLENNFSNGEPGIAAGINIGILYLLLMPYLAAVIIGVVWYKSTRNAKKNISGGVA